MKGVKLDWDSQEELNARPTDELEWLLAFFKRHRDKDAFLARDIEALEKALESKEQT